MAKSEQELNIFKIEYSWYEEDHDETLLGKNTTKEQFEKDLVEARNFAKSLVGIEVEDGDYLGKGYRVGCLPECYKQIIWYLITKLGYYECEFNSLICYDVDDEGPFEKGKIILTRVEKRIERIKIGKFLTEAETRKRLGL